MAFDPVRPGTQAIAQAVQQILDAWQGVSGKAQAMSLTALRSSSYALTIRNLDTANGGRHFRVLKSDDPLTVLFAVSDTGLSVSSFLVTSQMGLAAGTLGSPSLYIIGDTNTGLYAPAADQLAGITGGAVRLLLKNAGVDVTGLLTASAGLTVSAGAVSLPAGSVAGTAIANLGIDTAQLANLGVTVGKINAGGTADRLLGTTDGVATSWMQLTSGMFGNLVVPVGALANGAATGAALGSDVVTLTGTQTVTNKTLTTPTLGAPLLSSYLDLSVITTQAAPSVGTRVYTKSGGGIYLIDAGGSEHRLADTDSAQTFTNKTLTNPVIGTIVNSGTLTLPTSTDTLVGRATTDTLTNKTLAAPTITTPSMTTVSVTAGGIAIVGDSTLADRIRVAGAAAYDATDTTSSVKVKIAGGLRMTAGGLVFPDNTVQTTAPTITSASMTDASDITLTSDSDNSGAGAILLKTGQSGGAVKTRVVIPSVSTAGGVLDILQGTVPAASAQVDSTDVTRIWASSNGRLNVRETGGSSAEIPTVPIAAADLAAGTSAWLKIGEVSGTGSSNALVISSIPGTYRSLYAEGLLRGTSVATNMIPTLYLNADGSGSYDYQDQQVITSGWGATEARANTTFTLGHVADNGVTGAAAGAAGTLKLWLPYYADTTFHKGIHSEMYTFYADSASGQITHIVKGRWRKTEAITSIDVRTGSGNWTSTSKLTLWGLPA